MGEVSVDNDNEDEDDDDDVSEDEVSEDDEDEVEEDNDPDGVFGVDCEQTPQCLSGLDSEDFSELEDVISINGMIDILNIDMKNITFDVVLRYDFVDLQVAYQFYCWYARLNGFSVRKGQVVRNNFGEIVQQTFLCSRQGFRESRGLTTETRRRVQKHLTRCGCLAKFRVHSNIHTQWWYMSLFSFDHNHRFLEEKYCALLPAHRKMTTVDIMQIENFKKVCITSTSHVWCICEHIWWVRQG